MECPQGTCNNIEKLHDKINPLIVCVKGKVGWKQIGLSIFGLLTIITTITLYSIAAEKKQNDKIAKIPVIQRDIEHINENIKELKNSVHQIDKKLEQQISKDDLKKLIEAVRRNNGG